MRNYVGLLKSLRTLVEIRAPVTVIQRGFFLLENLTVIAKMETDEGKKKAKRDGTAIRQTEYSEIPLNFSQLLPHTQTTWSLLDVTG